ncbi:MAG: hypothetical protein Q9160_001348 [Pyrenula sp. 1 TL-2023]
MAPQRLNILVYSGALTYDAWWNNQDLTLPSGNGSTVESVRHVLYTFRRLLAPNYAVIPVTGDMIIKEPWTATCAAFVMPGGADNGYCRTLNGEGNRRIRQWVERGGSYIGFCAGGYYGSSRCEFEVGNRKMEVVGDRELQFFPGICRGCAFPGFVYSSEEGARAAELKVNKTALAVGTVPDVFKTYYNGGGVFVDAEKYGDKGVEVLANYTEELGVDSGEGKAAVLYCKIGEGAALLTGPHPEFVFRKPVDCWTLTEARFAAVNLDKKADGPEFPKVIDAVADDEKHRMDFLKACLTKIGLRVNEEQNVPSLSRIHLSSLQSSDSSELVSDLQSSITVEDDEEYLKDNNDTFHIVKPSTWKMGKLMKSLLEPDSDQTDQTDGAGDDRIVDYNSIVKQVLIHDEDYPASKETPYFNHHAFYANLKYYHSKSKSKEHDEHPIFGKHLLYGEVVTSTNTMLEKNTTLLQALPTGFTATATVQLAGRGRGSNVWVSPAGSLMFSTVVRHPMTLMSTAPVVFVQYLAAMAVVEGIKSYDGDRYRDMPVKLKWPNDIFALDPNMSSNGGSNSNSTLNSNSRSAKNYTKIGGILVNSHYNSTSYIAVVGCGLNTTNAAPTTSLNALLSSSSPSLPSSLRTLPPFTPERLLSSILLVFEAYYLRFLRTGFDRHFEELYYRDWLHMGQVVTLENADGGAKARIKAVTRDYGLLVAEEVVEGYDGRERTTGKVWELQSDSNSFDFFRGLVRRKEV